MVSFAEKIQYSTVEIHLDATYFLIKQLGKYLHSQPENILGGSPERAAAPGDQGGGRPHGPGRGRHGAPARRRADGLPGLHQVDGQGGTNIYSRVVV